MNEIHLGIFESLTKESALTRKGKGPSGGGRGLIRKALGDPPKNAMKILKQVAKEKGKKVEDLRGSDFPTFGKKY